jgi:hypothetical protein
MTISLEVDSGSASRFTLKAGGFLPKALASKRFCGGLAMAEKARSRRFHLLVGLMSLLFVSALVVRTSASVFSDTTGNTSNQWTAGDVILVDDDLGSSMFTVLNMKPTTPAIECITVTYQGSLDANVRLYGSLTAGDGLDDYLNLTVDRGTGGSFGDCSGFSSTEVVYSGTVDGFAGTHTAFSDGAGTWAPTGGAPDDDMTYQFTVTLQDDNAAQGLTTTATFTWEAQNT